MKKLIYQKLVKPFLFQMNPETAHRLFVWLGGKVARFRWVQFLIHVFYGTPKGTPVTVVDGVSYASPICLSAGFDYNGKLAHCLWAVGFGGEEVGSVTARACVGNESPQMTRLIKSQSILVYKGLKNDGVDRVIERIKSKKIPPSFVLGMSIAKTNDEKSVELQDGIDDYAYSLSRLVEENVGDFYTINVSCPNVFGGEDFASADRLELLLKRLVEIKHERPMYVKLPINKQWDDFKELLEVVAKYKLNGVVIGNLNKDYDALSAVQERPAKYRGGLSGLPCRELSNQLIKKTREFYPENFTIIGCGGILCAEDAMEKLRLGADLTQMITGMIFNGPHLMREISKEYKVQSVQKSQDLAK